MQHDEGRSHSSERSSERGRAPSKRSAAASRRESFVAGAISHVGHRCRPGGLSEFARRVGYSGHEIPWSGSFVDCVARDAGVVIPSCVYTPSGLAEFFHADGLVSTPEPGDIVFYNFSTKPADSFSMPHVGIVVNTGAWKISESFVSVEGGVDNAVVSLVRWRFDVMAFARPDFFFDQGRLAKAQANNADGPVFLVPERVVVGGRGRDIVNVQLALSKVVGLRGETPGVFDYATQRAFARWQRIIGHIGVDIDGIPRPPSLRALGERSGIFVVPDKN